MTSFRVAATGTARVYCVHDRQKRQVTTEAQVVALGLEVGQVYDPKQHRLWLCACCENLFVDPSDEPRYCRCCERRNVHPTNGALPQRNGRPHG